MNLKFIKSEFESLNGDHPIYKFPTWKIYGPYESKKDNRLRVVAYDGIRRITISYPKFIMECKNKKVLGRNEDVHHKDDNIQNNLIENFEIINETDHKRYHKLDTGSSKHGTYLMCVKLGCRCILCYSYLRFRRRERRRKGQ